MACRLECVCKVSKLGQALAVVGAPEALGEWDTARALRLSTSPEQFPVWVTEVQGLQPGAEFKFILVGEEGSVTWEPLQGNRLWSGQTRVATTWGQVEECQTQEEGKDERTEEEEPELPTLADARQKMVGRTSSLRMRLIPCQPGKIQDFYDLGSRRLGEGGFGAVTKARCLHTGFSYAVKTVVKKNIGDDAAFQNEFQIARSMDHPNIVKIFESFEDHRSIYLVMELCEGGELFDRIVELGHLTEKQAAMLAQQFCMALCYVHEQGVCHRDLKPENFLFVHKGAVDESPVKLIDFGLSKRFQPGEPLRTPVGTAYYVAPEVLSRSYGPACDMWSCGILVYTLLCGHPPFSGDDRSILKQVRRGQWDFKGSVWQSISEGAHDLIRKLLEMNPQVRLTAAQALEHPWVTGLSSHSPAHLGEELVNNLRTFGAHSQFRKAALNVIADQLDESQIHDLKEAFLAIDANNNGTLTPSEMHQALASAGLSRPEWTDIVQKVDMDSTGCISYTEFIAACMDRRKYIHEDVCWHAFKVFDHDGDGRITIDELREVFAHEGVQQMPNYKALVDAIHEVDTNGDGVVEFDEFVSMVTALGS